jgi:GNAT superfamily N-acetyltransferase
MTVGGLLIRPAEIADFAGFRALYRHLIPDDLPFDDASAKTRFAELLVHPGMTIFGGFANGMPVSSCTLVVIPNLLRGGRNYALIENVVTHADHRQNGYGRAVLNYAVEQAFSQNCYKVMLLTGSTNPATLRFYSESGFATTKTGFEIRRL